MKYKKELEHYKREKQVMGAGARSQFYNTVIAMLERIIELLEKKR